MRYISIMGDNEELKQLLAKALINKGFHMNKAYVQTDEKIDEQLFKTVGRDKFYKLYDNKILISVENFGGRLYGTAEPFGHINYIGLETDIGYEKLKEKYGEQIERVDVTGLEDNTKESSLIVRSYSDIPEIVNKITGVL